MGELRITERDELVEWDPADRDAVRTAYRRYERLKRDGYAFFAGDGRRLTRFDKKIPRIVAVRSE